MDEAGPGPGHVGTSPGPTVGRVSGGQVCLQASRAEESRVVAQTVVGCCGNLSRQMKHQCDLSYSWEQEPSCA